MKINIYEFMLPLLSVAMVFALFAYIVRIKNKEQIHYIFIANTIFLNLWSLGVIMQKYWHDQYNGVNTFFVSMNYMGVAFLSVSFLLTGLIFAKTKINFTKKYLIFFIIPMITVLIVWTNSYHKLFLVKYSFLSSGVRFGKYFWVHTTYNYACIFIGLTYLISFSVKNSGILSRQSFLIILGTLAPFVVNIIGTFNIIEVNQFMTPIAFSFSIVCFWFSILRYSFLDIVPIAFRTVVDNISDGFIVIDKNLRIIDFNRSLIKTFGNLTMIKRKDSFIEMIKSFEPLNLDYNEVNHYIKKALEYKEKTSFEHPIDLNGACQCFEIEISPILSKGNILGTVIIVKDITEHKNNLKIIKQNQEIILEQERLASLGQMIGGIAHNLSTPIMSIAGAIEIMKDIVTKYEDTIGNSKISDEEHGEFAKDVKSWIKRAAIQCEYMGEVIKTVKGQAVKMNESNGEKFFLNEMVKRVEILMKSKLNLHRCKLVLDMQVEDGIEMKGEMNNLIQVINNLIVNSIDAYGIEGGNIELSVLKEDDNIKFIIKDNGKGIPRDIQEKIFKRMITTKGKNGTGLGLYMSYSTIKGRFGGNIRFHSEEGKGTTFYIEIPHKV
ncbi:MAG: ATP-binding protein [Clostridia bacterium]|nr:ATP-binding protein [Clostridia bacterium]